MSGRIVLLCGGGDWYNASADPVVCPNGRDPKADIRSYPGYSEAGRRFLLPWLEQVCGWRRANDDEVLTVWEDET